MSPLKRLSLAASGTHLADHIALVSVPLVAALAFGASPAVLGTLVACQSMAHLVGSLPFGILVDRWNLRRLACLSALLLFVGSCGAIASILSHSVFGFGGSVTLAGFGTVLFGLTALSIIARSTRAEALGRANSAIEVPRASWSFLAPLLIGLVFTDVPAWILFLVAGLGALFALAMSSGLPDFATTASRREPVLAQIRGGARYVFGHRLLLPIAVCAVFWNFAFAALLVALVPAIAEIFAFDAGSFGLALSAFGLAAICGSWLSGRISGHVPPSVILIFGPGSSALAAVSLLLIGPSTPATALYAAFFFLGFGPSMWLVAQNSVRQLVTPKDMLGRANAVIQTAIYGIRPLGALIGGLWVVEFGASSALHMVAACFLASFAVPLFSDLRRVESYGALGRSPDNRERPKSSLR